MVDERIRMMLLTNNLDIDEEEKTMWNLDLKVQTLNQKYLVKIVQHLKRKSNQDLMQKPASTILLHSQWHQRCYLKTVIHQKKLSLFFGENVTVECTNKLGY